MHGIELHLAQSASFEYACHLVILVPKQNYATSLGYARHLVILVPKQSYATSSNAALPSQHVNAMISNSNARFPSNSK